MAAAAVLLPRAAAAQDPVCPNVRSSLQGVMLETRRGQFPDVGAVVRTEAGQPMAYNGALGRYPLTVRVDKDIHHPGDGRRDGGDRVTVPAGEYRALETYGQHVRLPVPRAEVTSRKGERYTAPRVWFVVERTTAKVFLMWDRSETSRDERRIELFAPTVAIQYCTSPAVGGFSAQIDFSGVAGSVITLTYKEFSSGWSRPAFTQDITYDLAQGSEISFRGARFEIIKATNTEITYRLLKTLE
jgi:hypothetical protein